MERTKAPKFYQPDRIKLIFPERVELANDVQLFWFQDVKDVAVKLDIEWNAGSSFQEKHLVAGFTNRLMLSGTPSKSAQQIAEEVDYYGGFAHQELDKDHASVSLFGLQENMSSIFNVFRDAFDQASFPKEEFEKDLRIKQNKFKIDSEKVKVLCQRAFNKGIFGAQSVYGQVAEYDDFDRIEVDDVIRFFDQKYRNQKPVVFLTGDVSDKFIDELKDWTKQFSSDAMELGHQEFHQSKGRIEAPKKDAMQSAIRIGRLMFNKKHPDYFGFQLLNTVLGGYFGSRLMANIREDKGYTYGIGSGMSVLQRGAYFFISTEVAAEVKEATIDEIYKELEKLKTEPISEEELSRVKNYFLGEFLRQADGPMAMMENFKNIYFNDLSEEYYSDFIQAIHDIKADKLQELAVKYFDRKEMLEVIAG